MRIAGFEIEYDRADAAYPVFFDTEWLEAIEARELIAALSTEIRVGALDIRCSVVSVNINGRNLTLVESAQLRRALQAAFEPPPDDQSEKLYAAHDAGQVVRFDYAASDGAATHRMVKITDISNGLVHGYDYGREAPRTFDIDRISGVRTG